MEQFNTFLNEQLGAKYVNTSISSVPDWNRLSIYELGLEFDNELHKFVRDYDVPYTDEEQPKW